MEFFRTKVLVDNTPELSPKPSSQRHHHGRHDTDQPNAQPAQPRALAKEEWCQQQSCEQTAQVPLHGDVLRYEAVDDVGHNEDDGCSQI